MSPGFARLVAPIAIAALLVAPAASPVAAQAPAGLTDLRTSLEDDSGLPARLSRPQQPKRKRSIETEPAGQIPSFGSMAGRGAGKTGFLSVKTKKAKGRRGATRATPPLAAPLSLAPSGPLTTPERTASADTGPPAPAPAPTARIAARPATPPKPPALAEREQRKEAFNALPNTVVAIPRKPEEDPFAPLGMRAGALLLRPALETNAGYDSNPGRVRGGSGSAFVAPAAELLVRSDWQRHEFAADIRGSYTAYEATPELDAPYLASRVAGRVDVTERTRLLLEGRYLLTAAHPGTPDLPAGLAELPIYEVAGASAGMVQRFNRLELAAKGTFERTEWNDSKLSDGSIISNKDRQYNQYGLQTRASYEMTPGVKPFVDVAVDTRIYDLPVDAVGVTRDSDGIAAKAGTSFELTRKLTGEAAVGYVTRTYKDPSLPELRGVLVDASLLWAATGLTNVKLDVKTTPQETTLFGVSGLLSYDTALQVDHAFRRWLIGTARLSYGIDDFVGSTRQDQRYAASAALTYKLTRTVQVKGEVRHEWRRSNAPGDEYEATVGIVGLRWQP